MGHTVHVYKGLSLMILSKEFYIISNFMRNYLKCNKINIHVTKTSAKTKHVYIQLDQNIVYVLHTFQ